MEITKNYATVLKHRLKKQKIVHFNMFKLYCESGFASKEDAKKMALKSIDEIKKIVDNINE